MSAEPVPKDDDGAGTELRPWVGRVLDGRYRILEQLGEGGMGLVFVAEHLRLRKRVAIKTIAAALADRPEIAARFEREAMATAHLEHPHIVGVLDYGTLPDGTAYLVSQLVEGPSLSQRIADAGRIPWPEACRLASQIAAGVAAAHGQGIVHRDLKPENVLLAPQLDGPPAAKVLDFGIARVIGDALGPDAQATLTRHGMVLGTPGYMAPEQALGQPAHPRADLYALGVILWEMLTGTAPYASQTALTNIVTRQLTEPLPDLREAMDGQALPPPLVELLRSLLAPEPGNRLADAAVARDALRSIERSEEPPASGRGAPPSRETPAPAHHEAAEPEPSGGLGRTIPIAGAVVLGLAIVAIAASAWGGGSTERPPVASTATPSFSDGRFGLGSELEPDVVALIQDPRPEARRAAAQRLLHSGALAALPRALVQLELATTCDGRRDAIETLRTTGDPRALPALERWQQSPDTGCGPGEGDCNRCLRDALGAALVALRAER